VKNSELFSQQGDALAKHLHAHAPAASLRRQQGWVRLVGGHVTRH